jgi:hypothetical protein
MLDERMKLEAALQSRIRSLTDPENFVREWLSENDYTITGAGNFVRNGEDEIMKIVFDYLWLDYKRYYRAESVSVDREIKATYVPQKRFKVQAIVESDMRKALDKVQNEQVISARKEAIAAVKTTGEDLSELRKWVKAISGNESNVELVAIAHFIWSVKRKLTKQKVIDHIMPVIYGPQGGGKSEAVAALTKPLEELCYHANSVEVVTDEKYMLAMGRYYVMIFDEMASADKADIEKLKGQVSAKNNSVRLFHTQNVSNVVQNCSFIGTSNKPINEMIYDTTGMRRFYQLDALKKVDWDAINSIDYLKLWKGVDENRHRGYVEEEKEALKMYQAQMEAKDDITTFIEEMEIDLSVGPYKMYSMNDLYANYRMWCERSGSKVFGKSNFGTKLTNRLKQTSKVVKIDGETHRQYELNASCKLEVDLEQANKILNNHKKGS